ncbi:flagellar basal body P-ring formation chaperone FlgA [Notoacmeibacter ruber]|uniref:Flagella basal body P-ring formation protein FlgA n=1 Tax=Notoacmeibacter ruber TaxID=2670375 RepID=A0A3L7JEE2_9HYPH|nr:flagellar basal body P-ring formation chaperone FlgA [Notoacmeibacter ruber]RLQ88824.1 flagella basal body P-ring formation protein FlgA [Notoacmeibacter ruber]
MAQSASKRLARLLLLGAVASVPFAGVSVGDVPAAQAEPVVVARRVIHPGEPVEATDLQTINTKSRVLSDAPFVSDVSQIQGMVAQRTILPERLILLASLRRQSAISAGMLVPVTYKNGALSIRMDAVALTDAAEGEAVTLRNRDTGRQIEAVAQADGTAVLLP